MTEVGGSGSLLSVVLVNRVLEKDARCASETERVAQLGRQENGEGGVGAQVSNVVSSANKVYVHMFLLGGLYYKVTQFLFYKATVLFFTSYTQTMHVL